MRERRVNEPLRKSAPHVVKTVTTPSVEALDTGTGYTIKVWRTDVFMSNREVITAWSTKIYDGGSWYTTSQSATTDLVRKQTILELAMHQYPSVTEINP